MRKVDRASEKTKGILFKRLAPAKKKAYNEVFSAMYEVISDTSVAHDYVSKILRLLRAK